MGRLAGRSFPSGGHVVLDAHNGALISRSVDIATPAMSAIYVVYGIHFATYGGLGLKLLYFLLGIGGWLTILSGNWIWLERRAARRASRGNVILGRLTLGVGGGIIVAAAAILWINRLAAPTVERPGLEIWGFFGTWALVSVVALAVPHHRRSWAVLLGIADAGIAMVPILSVLFSPAHLGNGGGLPGWRAAGVDIGAAAIGILLLLAARAAWRYGATAVARHGIAKEAS